MADPEGNIMAMEQIEEQQTKAILKRCGSYAQGSIVAATAILIAAFSVGKNDKLHLQHHVLVAGGCFLVFAFFSSLLLLYFKIFLLECNKLDLWHIRVLQFLCLTSGTALIATNSLLLILVDKGNWLLALNLVPMQAIIGVVAYCATPTETSSRDEVFKKEIKKGGKIALFASAMAFAVQTTVVFGYLNNASFQALGHRFDIAVSFLASALSVFLVMATCMPLGYRTPATRDRVLSFLRHLKGAVIALIVVTAVMLAQEFLGVHALLALLPEITVAAMHYAVTLLSDVQEQDQGDAVEQKMDVLPSAVVATFGLAMLGAAYATMHGTPEYGEYTKALVFTVLAAVMSSLARVAGPLCGSLRDKNTAPWVVFLGNTLPVVEMLVAVPLAAKVAIDFLLVA